MKAVERMEPEEIAAAAGIFLAEAQKPEIARPARLTLEAVAGVLLKEFAFSALEEPPEDPDDPEELPEGAEIIQLVAVAA